MAGLRFSHVALNCLDPTSVERFYTRNFGFRRARAIPLGDGEIVFLKCGDVYLELFAAEGTTQAGGAHSAQGDAGDGPNQPGVRHLAFQVDDVDEHLKAMSDDADITLGPLDFEDFIPGWRTVWLRDPEGNIVEVSQGYRDQDDLSTLGKMPAGSRAAGSSPEERNIR